MNRITDKYLEAVVARINAAMGTPCEPYTQNADGHGFRANIGCYHLSHAYGGVSLHQMSNASGGVRDVFGCGHVPKRDLGNRMHAFLAGIDTAVRS